MNIFEASKMPAGTRFKVDIPERQGYEFAFLDGFLFRYDPIETDKKNSVAVSVAIINANFTKVKVLRKGMLLAECLNLGLKRFKRPEDVHPRMVNDEGEIRYHKGTYTTCCPLTAADALATDWEECEV